MGRLLKAGPHPLCWGGGGCEGVTVISTRFIVFYSFMVRHCARHQFCPTAWSSRSQRRLARLFFWPLLTLEKNNCRNTVYLPSNSFSLGPHSWPYLHPALSPFAYPVSALRLYPVSALRLRFWLAWISSLVFLKREALQQSEELLVLQCRTVSAAAAKTHHFQPSDILINPSH